ncbi:MAG: hypothetical protein ACLFO2_03450 [Candidatus Woesearchaeota archaeon]
MSELTREELKEYYEEELQRRDKRIEELEEENKMLMRTALRRASDQEHLKERLDRLEEQDDKKDSE